MYFRRAKQADADTLLAWRNDPETRRQSHSNRAIQRQEHIEWLDRTLADASRTLLIAEEGGPVGTVRIDWRDGDYELSWTVAPAVRGEGIGKRMVSLALSRLDAPAVAEIKDTNFASVRVAEYAGMRLDRHEDGVLYYRTP